MKTTTNKGHLICLGIESTAHTFGAAVVSSKKEILSDVRDMYTSETGIIPVEAARHHEKLQRQMIQEAIQKSGQKKIDLVAFSQSPGLPPCLKVGMLAAKEIAKELNVPIIGVNHIVAHLISGHLFTQAKNPVYVFCSGANTQIIALEGGYFRIFGETLDSGLGNSLDKFGRGIGLGFPAGPKIEALAEKGKFIELPYVVKGMDLSFAGIVTSAVDKFKKGAKEEDLCFSMQETLFSMLTEVTERALAHTGKKEAVLIGGVAANKRLCAMLDVMCKQRGAKFFQVPLKYCGDQGVMIAYQGILEHLAGKQDSINKIDINPYQRVDEIKVFW
ncbi:MAG: KEOPS complex N(6)-L-threonylcarbamoyladenine synthase Kae1 [Candidatus Nanoarchaeia archaeon]|nr:KEOPS complex N(6)-L-threonylcarbamoyladenine synthase Kae1 [Candidatus Nanoarchaeia archaeon]MDD5587531.1 KEOPS complex N(6)-L-threonylcarbamoyladenine synthase Kae1 [Candidatus Nanoarchaeia archaeon]